MFFRIFYCASLIFLLSGPKAFSASFCEDFFSKTASFIRGESGAVRWKFWQNPPPPPTDILTELSQKSTQVESSINVYSKMGMNDFVSSNEIEYLYGHVHNIPEIKDLRADPSASSTYWSRYVPRRVRHGEDRSLQYKGQFIIGFGKLFYAPEERSMKTRTSYWYHRIHWDSGARDMPQLDQKTIRQIFTEIYGGEPEKIVTEFQRQYVKENHSKITESEKRYIFPLISLEGREQIKQTVLRILQERDNHSL